VQVIDLLEDESLTFHDIGALFLLPRLKTLRAANVRSHRLPHSGMVRPEWYRWKFGERRSALENLVLLSSAAYPECMEELLRPLDNLKMLAWGHQSRRDFGSLPWKSVKASWDTVMTLQSHLNRLEKLVLTGESYDGGGLNGFHDLWSSKVTHLEVHLEAIIFSGSDGRYFIQTLRQSRDPTDELERVEVEGLNHTGSSSQRLVNWLPRTVEVLDS
jgi:hypothetical protein